MSFLIGLLFAAASFTCTASRFKPRTRGFAESPKAFNLANEVPEVWQSRIFGEVIVTLYDKNILYMHIPELDRIIYAAVDRKTNKLEPKINDDWESDGIQYTLECQ